MKVVLLIRLTLLHVGKAEVRIHVTTPVLVDSRELAVPGRKIEVEMWWRDSGGGDGGGGEGRGVRQRRPTYSFSTRSPSSVNSGKGVVSSTDQRFVTSSASIVVPPTPNFASLSTIFSLSALL